MINYIEQHECELCDFVAWAGGAEILNKLLKHEEAYNFASEFIEEVIVTIDSADVTDTLINDLLWFDVPEALEEAGFNPDTFERQ